MVDKNKAQKSKEEREARRTDVKDIMETLGINSVPRNVLAEKYNCSTQTIDSDINFWVKRIKFKDIKLEGSKLIMMIRRNFEILEEVSRSKNESNKIRAVAALNQSMETLTKISEDFGLKEKIKDRHEIEIVNKMSKEEIEAEVKRLLGK